MSVTVTDHAVLRYLERVHDIDVAAIRFAIAESCARHQGAPCVRALGARFLIREGRVVTAIGHRCVPHWQVLSRLSRKSNG